MAQPRMRIAATVLDSSDPRALAAFYEQLLAWAVAVSEPARPGSPPEDGWVMVRPPNGGTGLSFQYEPDYIAPTWPPTDGAQRMMMHLDIAVEDLEAGVDWACRLGARVAEHQPQEGVRAMLDPDGHPFCLFAGSV